MVEFQVRYTGEKHCDLVHIPSSSSISTDAPLDNFGKGETFSPTDLMSVSLATCMLTVLAIWGEPLGYVFKGASARVEKHMGTHPRRVSKIKIDLVMPSTISSDLRDQILEMARNCPVHKSIHPDIDVDLSLNFSLA